MVVVAERGVINCRDAKKREREKEKEIGERTINVHETATSEKWASVGEGI